jgi:hypothetical protein
MKEQIIIFCQAPADIQHVLMLYEKYKEKKEISIYNIHVEGSYQFLKSLNLNIKELVFIPYDFNLSLKRPYNFIKARKKIKRLLDKYFVMTFNTKVFFFSPWFDWLTFYFLGELQKQNNTVIYYKHYLGVSEEGRDPITIKEKITIRLFNYLTGLKLQFVDSPQNHRLFFPFYKYKIHMENSQKINLELLSKYKYSINTHNKKSILLFESNMENNPIIIEYISTMQNILKYFKNNNYTLYIKPHPRLGYTEKLRNYFDDIIPSEVPAELIDISNFDCIFGISSSSLASSSKRHANVYSLINLFQFEDSNLKSFYIEYLNKNSNNKIKYTNNILELCQSKS